MDTKRLGQKIVAEVDGVYFLGKIKVIGMDSRSKKKKYYCKLDWCDLHKVFTEDQIIDKTTL